MKIFLPLFKKLLAKKLVSILIENHVFYKWKSLFSLKTNATLDVCFLVLWCWHAYSMKHFSFKNNFFTQKPYLLIKHII